MNTGLNMLKLIQVVFLKIKFTRRFPVRPQPKRCSEIIFYEKYQLNSSPIEQFRQVSIYVQTF